MTGGGPGGWASWEWDETLFAGAARHYVQGRTPYAPGLADALAVALHLDGGGRLLDVGCGPGVIAVRVAHLFEEVVGLDPDQAMLDEAERRSVRSGIVNATWVRMRAEDLPAGLGRFRAVTFAASFHWMDRPRVAAAVRPMLTQDGAVVQIHAPAYAPTSSDPSLPHPAPPDDEIDALRIRYLGADRRAGRGIRNSSPSGEDAVFRAAGFAAAQRVIVEDGRVFERSIDDLVAAVFSMSSTAPHLFGSALGAFETDLRQLLVEVSPAGRFSIRLPDNVVDIWRAAA